jgi:hypothetical protein
MNSTTVNNSSKPNFQSKKLYKVGAIVCWILVAYSLVTMLSLVIFGGQPKTAQEAFSMLQQNRFIGLLRLDLLTILFIPLYFVLFSILFTVLRKTENDFAFMATILVFAGVTLALATPSVFSWLSLSDKFSTSTDITYKNQLLAAGETILASDLWHGSGAIMGGILMQTGAVLVSLLMRRSPAFGKLTANLGVVMHSLDLAHIIVAFFIPVGGVILLAIAGPLYLIWFPLLARDLFRLAKTRPIK